MGVDPPLSNAQLAEWVKNELGKYETGQKARTLQSGPGTVVPGGACANDDAEEGARLRAVIAGQQAISSDLPHLTLTGHFRAAPAPQGGWTVRYSARPANSFGSVALQFVECRVAANGTVSLDDNVAGTPNPRESEIALRRRR